MTKTIGIAKGAGKPAPYLYPDAGKYYIESK